ncbi:MAG: HupE/UreJ family protein [Saprospiraceae bacterium]|nr:HupE/UreJ family protein [Saprospiraceae bacterium]
MKKIFILPTEAFLPAQPWRAGAKVCLLLSLMALAFDSQAHTINYELAQLSPTDVSWVYLKLGFEHIVPLGVDHILFVLSIFFLSNRLRTIIWQATTFTLAHSITLGLAMYGYIEPLPAVVEPIIALSIFFVAVENILVGELKPSRLGIVFLFGLVHGMGFAGALSEQGLPPSSYLSALLSFNVGVELGQLAVILAAYFLVGRWFSKETWYRVRVVIPVSTAIALIALYWTVERTFG